MTVLSLRTLANWNIIVFATILVVLQFASPLGILISLILLTTGAVTLMAMSESVELFVIAALFLLEFTFTLLFTYVALHMLPVAVIFTLFWALWRYGVHQ